ncbi:hypothetical protein ACTID9_27235 [Brevibacillus fluminis]|uniref:hypothetical protein n=1 Tax=Brevibacillus fluminis TaxID=511487 RepID=UPI003F8A0865
MKNKKLALSVLSTAVVASMASSAFAAEQGFYIGGDVKHYYSLDSFFSSKNSSKIEDEANKVGLDQVVYVDDEGNAATLDDLLADGEDALTDDLEAVFGDSLHDNFKSVDQDGKEGSVVQPEPADGPVAADLNAAVDGNKVTITGTTKNAKKVEVTIVDKDNKDVATKTVDVVSDKFTAEFADLAAGDYTYEVVASNDDEDGDVQKGSKFTVAATELQVNSVTAVSTKSFKVEFNNAVDTTKAQFAIKKDNVTLNLSEVKFADDKKSATLSLSTKLTKGDYAVTVSGLTTDAVTKTVSVEDEKLAKVELSDVAVLTSYNPTTGSTFDVNYKAYNQYNEEITKSLLDDNISWNYPLGVQQTAIDKSKGIISLKAQAKSGDKFKITAVDAESGLVLQKDITIGDAATIGDATNFALYNADKKQIDTSNVSDFAVVFEAKDQYGNPVKAAAFNNEMVVTSSNPLVAGLNATPVADGTGDNEGKLVVALNKPTPTNIAGTTSIRMISKVTGKQFKYDVTVKDVAAVDTFTISAPQVLVAAGETVEIPFTAADQYGTAITSFADLDGKINFVAPNGSIKFENDYVNKKAVLKYTAPTTAGKYLISASTANGKQSTIFVDVKASATASVVSKAKDITNSLAVGANVKVAAKNFEVVDQYGRAVKLDSNFFGTYYLNVEASDGTADTVTLSATKITNTTDVLTLAAAKKGTEKFKVSIVKKAGDVPVAGSEIEFNVSVVDGADVTQYVADDVATIYDDQNTGYQVDLKVYGKKQDGTKVAVPSSKVTVVSSDSKVTYDPSTGKLDANKVVFDTNQTEKVVVLTIIVDTANGPVEITKNVTVTKKAPSLVSISSVSTEDVSVSGGVASIAANHLTAATLVEAFEGTDSYGETVAFSDGSVIAPGVYITFTGAKDAKPMVDGGLADLTLTNGDAANAAITGAEAGDSFNVTVVKEGKTSTLKVIVGAPTAP